MSTGRLPWEIVETFPSTDDQLIAHWHDAVKAATDPVTRTRALIGRGLALYWATQEGVIDAPWAEVAHRRTADLDNAVALARDLDDPDLIAEALLGVLYGTWGPDRHLDRGPIVAELSTLRPSVTDDEIRLRIVEWDVLQALDRSDLDAARRSIADFTQTAAGTGLLLFERREVLWRGCLAMLDGAIDASVLINQDAISATADIAGSPFSFQNVAITLAIERYLRRGLGDVVDAVRSIRASSPRVGANWDTGLAFALAEMGELDEARVLFRSMAVDRFTRVPRDLNWLVTMQLLGLIALTIDAEDDGPVLIDMLRPFGHLDGTHGSGYASYGPVGRVAASLMARWGDQNESEALFDLVLTTRAPGPWWALTWLDRARSRSVRCPGKALIDARRAEQELAHWGLDDWASSARDLSDSLGVAGHAGALALRTADGWTLHHATGSATVACSIGLEHLVWLLARPGVAVDIVELDPLVDGTLQPVALVESTLDDAARTQYRRRINALETQSSMSADECAEADFLRRELAGGRHAVSTSAELERLRVRVTKAIRRAIGAIADQSPELGAHLRSSIATGRTCAYDPADGQPWSVVRR